MTPSARTQLIEIYLDYRNNYLTVSKFAEHNGLSLEHGSALIDLARKVFQSEHPDM